MTGIGQRAAALKSFNVRTYLLGSSLSYIGTFTQSFAQWWLVLTITGNRRGDFQRRWPERHGPAPVTIGRPATRQFDHRGEQRRGVLLGKRDVVRIVLRVARRASPPRNVAALTSWFAQRNGDGRVALRAT